MSNLHIRPAITADVETLYRFEQDLIATERPFNPTIKAAPVHYYDLAAMIASPDIELLVAEYDNSLVASGYARIEPAKPYLLHPIHAYLGFMYVEPAHRGKNINIRIIEALRHWAHTRGITEMRLDVYCENTRAIRAYEKAGFIPHLLHMRQPI